MHTILVADDSVTIQRAVEIVFDKEPFTVVKAGSGHEALARIREVRPHLVLADHTMPDQSGYDLAAALKADPSTSAIPVVLLSAASNPYDEARGGAAGVVSHVQKPFDCATLLDRVRGILGVEATAPGTAVPAAAPTSTPATANMPRPPSLGGFAGLGGGLPRPPAPAFPPRSAVTPPVPVAPAAIPRAPTPAPARDHFGLEAALSQPPSPAAPVASTPPTSVPLTSPTAVETVTPSGWTAVSPGQGIPPTPTPQAPSTPGGLAELDEADLGFSQPAAPPPQPQPASSSTPTPAPQAVSAPDAAKVTAKLGLDAIAAATEASPAPAATVSAAVGAVVAQAAPAIAATTGEAPSRDALSAEARQIVERIAWEVVPELAETIIREELARLLKARGA